MLPWYAPSNTSTLRRPVYAQGGCQREQVGLGAGVDEPHQLQRGNRSHSSPASFASITPCAPRFQPLSIAASTAARMTGLLWPYKPAVYSPSRST